MNPDFITYIYVYWYYVDLAEAFCKVKEKDILEIFINKRNLLQIFNTMNDININNLTRIVKEEGATQYRIKQIGSMLINLMKDENY